MFMLFFMNIFFLLLSLLLISLIGKKFFKNTQITYLIILYCIITHISTISEIVQQNLNESLYFFIIFINLLCT